MSRWARPTSKPRFIFQITPAVLKSFFLLVDVYICMQRVTRPKIMRRRRGNDLTHDDLSALAQRGCVRLRNLLAIFIFHMQMCTQEGRWSA